MQPLFIVLGGALATVLNIRTVLAIGGTVCLGCSLFLPRGQRAARAAATPMLTGVPGA